MKNIISALGKLQKIILLKHDNYRLDVRKGGKYAKN